MSKRIGILRACALPAATALLLGACAVPSADKAIEDVAAPVAAAPRIHGAAGPLTVGQSKAVLANLSGDAGESGILERHLAIEEAVAGSPLTASNKVDLLRSGQETFAAIQAAIDGARDHVDIEFYIIEDVTLNDSGRKLADLLTEKLRQGVEINLIYDGYGSSDTPAEFFERLSQAGARLLEYHPVAPTNPVNVVTLNNRTHRKIVVADGVVGIVGGVNLSKSYESKSPGSDDDEDEEAEAADARDEGPGPATDLPDEWHDAAVRIEGPAVAELQALFRAQWEKEGGEPLPPPPAEPVAKGHEVVRIIGSTPDEAVPRYYVTLISALRNAETNVWISTAYFVPTPEEKEELMAAAERGIDVRLLLAGSSDSKEAVAAAQTHYSDLLRAGVRIYEVKDVVLHSKTVVIDGVWSAIGSSNLDYRSVIHNDEVDAIILGAETAAGLEQLFQDGIAMAEEIDRETWEESRPFGERFHGFLVRMWEHLL